MREVDRINKKLWLLNHNLVGNQKGGRNVSYITIQKALNVTESAEYQKIKSENKALLAETVRSAVERQELQDLRAELERARKETARKAAELEKRSIASVSSYEILNKQIQEMQNRMQEMYKRTLLKAWMMTHKRE
jgi:hypothetical protein